MAPPLIYFRAEVVRADTSDDSIDVVEYLKESDLRGLQPRVERTPRGFCRRPAQRFAVHRQRTSRGQNQSESIDAEGARCELRSAEWVEPDGAAHVDTSPSPHIEDPIALFDAAVIRYLLLFNEATNAIARSAIRPSTAAILIFMVVVLSRVVMSSLGGHRALVGGLVDNVRMALGVRLADRWLEGTRSSLAPVRAAPALDPTR